MGEWLKEFFDVPCLVALSCMLGFSGAAALIAFVHWLAT